MVVPDRWAVRGGKERESGKGSETKDILTKEEKTRIVCLKSAARTTISPCVSVCVSFSVQ